MIEMPSATARDGREGIKCRRAIAIRDRDSLNLPSAEHWDAPVADRWSGEVDRARSRRLSVASSSFRALTFEERRERDSARPATTVNGRLPCSTSSMARPRGARRLPWG